MVKVIEISQDMAGCETEFFDKYLEQYKINANHLLYNGNY